MRVSKVVPLFTAGMLVMCAASVRADYLASDNASNYLTPPGWVDGSNGGYGFTSWTFVDQQGDASNSIASNTPVGTSAWDLQSADDGSSSIGAVRGFSGFNTNDSILLDMDLDSVPADGGAGAYFYDSDGNFEFEIFVNSGTVAAYNSQYGATINPDDYVIEDNYSGGGRNEYVDTGISDIKGQAIHMDMTLLDGVSHAYTLTITQQGGASYTSPVGNTLFTNVETNVSEIDGVLFADTSTGTNPFLFNNFIVTPLPAAAFSAIPLLGILAATRLKRR